MRIIAGRWKGRRLSAPRWDGLRPTSDKLRETLFNVLALRVPGARVFDGFAGTGAVGLEALSRGAAHVHAVDEDARAVALMRANAVACGAGADYTGERRTVVAALGRPSAGDLYDVIFLDPPYEYPDVAPVLAAAAARLAPGGIVVLERATRREPPVVPGLRRMRDVRSGDSTLTLYEQEAGGRRSPEVA